jgi:hypothetical protein
MAQFVPSILASLFASLVVALVNFEAQCPQLILRRLCRDLKALVAGWTAFIQEKVRRRIRVLRAGQIADLKRLAKPLEVLLDLAVATATVAGFVVWLKLLYRCECLTIQFPT